MPATSEPVIIRDTGRVSMFVGWMLIGMAAVALVVFVVLALALGEAMMLVFLFAPVLLVAGGALNLWMGRRARLEIRDDGVLWCGFFGRPRWLPWSEVWQILMPPPGSRRRLTAVARLRNGGYVDIDALWISGTSPATVLGRPDLSHIQAALVDGHRAYLARTGSSRS